MFIEGLGSFTFSYLKPHSVKEGASGIVSQILQDNGFHIVYKERRVLTFEQVLELYPHLVEMYGEDVILTETALSNSVAESELMVIWKNSEQTAQEFRELIGNPAYDSVEAKGIRGLIAEGRFLNGIHGADSERDALNEISICCPQAFNELLDSRLWGDSFRLALFRNGYQEQMRELGVIEPYLNL